jgi:hypothetical protein
MMEAILLIVLRTMLLAASALNAWRLRDQIQELGTWSDPKAKPPVPLDSTVRPSPPNTGKI